MYVERFCFVWFGLLINHINMKRGVEGFNLGGSTFAFLFFFFSIHYLIKVRLYVCWMMYVHVMWIL